MVNKTNSSYISLFSLIMISIIAVDNIRSIPISAQYGSSIIFYYLICGIFFFLPSALCAAELASNIPEEGGMYIWIKSAFGVKCAFFVIWLQWIYNICWYPTILSVLAATIAYMLAPFAHNLTTNITFNLIVMISVYWFSTFINIKGIKFSAFFSNFCALMGTILPILLIIILGLTWLLFHPNNSQLQWHNWQHNLYERDNWILLSSILYGLLGIEISGYHAKNIAEPHKNFPKAIVIAAIFILSSLTLSSLSVAIVIPKAELMHEFSDGMLHAFSIFLQTFNIQWLNPFIQSSIIIGIIGGVAAWIIGPTKGLMVAAADGCLNKFFAQRNKNDVPQNILLTQAAIFSILCFLYLLVPNVQSVFVILSTLTAQLALLGYIFMFAATIKLRHKNIHAKQSFVIPGGKFGLYFCTISGIMSCVTAILLSFLTPKHIVAKQDIIFYEIITLSGLFLCITIPLIILKLQNKK